MNAYLTQEKGLIFRITHKDNLPWISEHGLHCASAVELDPKFKRIGNFDLIERRPTVGVSVPPGGNLCDYIPFYFTPHSPMFYNIYTGYQGIERVPNEDIVILVTALPHLQQRGIPFVFSDRHAFERTALFFNDVSDLNRLPWKQLRERNFNRDPDDPLRVSRYQAEALIHRHLPVDALLGIVCYTQAVTEEIQSMMEDRYPAIKIKTLTSLYFGHDKIHQG